MQAELPTSLGDKVIELIEKLASQIGKTAEQFWPIFIYQQKLSGITNLCVCLLVFVIAVIVAFKILSLLKGDPDKIADNIALCLIVPFFFIGAMFAVGYFVMYAPGFTSKLLNPEYYAVTDIISRIR